MEVVFTNLAGTPTDPGTVTFRMKKPDGVVSTPTPTNPSVGTWRYEQVVDKEGKWYYRFEGTGSVTAAFENYFTVKDSAFYLGETG